MPVDPATIAAALAAASSGIDLINKLADKVIPLITGHQSLKKAHRMIIEGEKDKIVAKEHGQTVHVITGTDLEKLPAEMLKHVKVYEASAEKGYEIWKKVYPDRNTSADPVINAKVELQLRGIVANMKDDLDGILEFLETAGMRLDDHYLMFRDAIKRSS